MNAKHCIEYRTVLCFVNALNEMLDSNSVVTIPKQSRLIVFIVYATSIVCYVPTTSKMLCETSDITTVCIHKVKVTISLQQTSSKQRVWVDDCTLAVIGVNLSHVLIRTSDETTSQRQNHSNAQSTFLYIFGNECFHCLCHYMNEYLELKIYVKTVATT